MQVWLGITVVSYFPVLGFHFFSHDKILKGRFGLCLCCFCRRGLAKKEEWNPGRTYDTFRLSFFCLAHDRIAAEKRGTVFCWVKKKRKYITVPPVNTCQCLFYPHTCASEECLQEQSFSHCLARSHKFIWRSYKRQWRKKLKMTTGFSWVLLHALAQLERKHTPFLGRETLCISHLSALISQVRKSV